MFLKTVQQVKRFFIILIGLTVMLAGVVMLVTPGPGWAMIFGGLAILAAAEVVWAKRLMERLKAQGIKIKEAIRPSNGGSKPPLKQDEPAKSA
jgi:uncharacterized protein (TIGR02611 family)